MHSFRNKLLLSISLTIVLVLLVSAILIGFAVNSRIKHMTRNEMQTQNRLAAVAVDQLLQDYLTDTRMVASVDVLGALDQGIVEPFLKDVIAQDARINTLAVLTSDGFSVASAGCWQGPALPLLLNQTRLEFYQASKANRGEVFVKGPVVCRGTSTIVMLTPIISPLDSQPSGVLAMVGSLEPIVSLTETYKGIASDRCVFILDQMGRVVLSDHRGPTADAVPMDAGIEFEDEFVDHVGEGGICQVSLCKPVGNGMEKEAGIAAVARLSPVGANGSLGWSIVSAIPLYEINQQAFGAAITVFLLGLGWIPILIGCLYFLADQVTGPIEQAAARAKEIASGDLTGEPLAVEGTDEVWQLMQCMNDMSEELRKAANTNETAMRLKSEFLANMSHEIRTPMSAILGHTELLNEPDLSGDQRGESISTIQRNGLHLLDILNDILDVSKLEAGKVKLHRRPIQLASFIEDVASLMRARAVKKGLYLSVDYPIELPSTIYGDEVRIRQIMINLIGNAIKFTELGGVTVNVRWCEEEEDSTLKVVISDTGVGISTSELSNVFDAFVQGDSSLTRQYGGAGLGLRISQELALLMGGGVVVSSKVGIGSTFAFDIHCPANHQHVSPRSNPIQCLSATQNPTQASKQRDPGEVIRILVVEDGEDSRRLFQFLLERAGMQATLAENGIEAIEAVKTADTYGRPFDLILMDMQMPVLDGYEATRRLKNSNCPSPIIAITAHSLEDDRLRCLEAGCDDYLSKPIDNRLLVDTCLDWSERIERANEVRRLASSSTSSSSQRSRVESSGVHSHE